MDNLIRNAMANKLANMRIRPITMFKKMLVIKPVKTSGTISVKTSLIISKKMPVTM